MSSVGIESHLAMMRSNRPGHVAIGAGRAIASCLLLGAMVPHAGAQAERSAPVRLDAPALPEPVRAEIAAAIGALDFAETPLAARRLAQRATGLARTVLNANAHFDPVIESRIDVGPPPRPVLEIAPGPAFTIAGLRIDFADPAPPEGVRLAVERALDLARGDIAIPSRVIDQEALIIGALRRAGYPDADTLGRETVGNREAGTVDIRYSIRSGPPVLLGEVVFETDGRVRDSFLTRFISFPPGTPYAPGELDRLRDRLGRDRLFGSVQVALSDTPSRIAPSGAEVRNVHVRLRSRPRNRVAAGVSFATDEGLGLRLEHERRDLSKRADSLRTELAVADLRRELALTWDRPHEFGFGRDLELSVIASDETTDAFDSQRLALLAQVDHTVSDRLSFTYGISGESLRETLLVETRALRPLTRSVQSLKLLGGVRIDRADDPLDARRGWRAETTVEPSIAQGDVDTQLLRLGGQVRAYRPIGVDERVVAAVRMRLGTVLGGSFIDIPSEQRFFGGGGGSVRGYEYQSIGPATPDGRPVGGQSVLEVSAELRYRLGEKLGLVAFIDGGEVSASTSPSIDAMRFGAGFGVRYDTVAGPIRLDIATPLDPRESDDALQIYLSIGQAF